MAYRFSFIHRLKIILQNAKKALYTMARTYYNEIVRVNGKLIPKRKSDG